MIRKLLDLSTIHLPQRFWEEGGGAKISGWYQTEHGAFMWVPDDPDDTASASINEDDAAPEILTLRHYARELGCDYVLLDADADPVTALPTYGDDLDGDPAAIADEAQP